jgi:hypothetical protein
MTESAKQKSPRLKRSVSVAQSEARDPISAELDFIDEMNVEALRARWRTTRDTEASKGLPPQLLRAALAYDIQVARFGGLRLKTRRRLARLAARLKKDPDAPLLIDEPPTPGARLTMEWRGKRHVVEVLNDGFAYRGETYTSLSEIARMITGARWSGPRFFGLKGRTARR